MVNFTPFITYHHFPLGVLYHVSDSGNCVEVLQADGGIKRLLHHESRNLLVVITEGMVLGQFSVALDGSVTEVNKVSKCMIFLKMVLWK